MSSEENTYSDEYNRTHEQPESQRDPTLFENTNQDNLVDISANGANSEITNTITEELAKLSTTQDITDNHSPSKSEEHIDKSKKTPSHSPTRRKSITHDTHKKPVHHSPTRRKSIPHDANKDVSNHSNAHNTRRKSNTHEHDKDQLSK